MVRLVQLHRGSIRRVAVVDEPRLRLVRDFDSVHALTRAALAAGTSPARLVERALDETLDYDAVYSGRSDWRLMPPVDHPDEPARCLVSGTGLTHLGSAKNRQSMHEVAAAQLTDSMKMFRLGVERGRPPAGKIGAAPEWFYKGTGALMRAHGEPLDVPPYAEEGGEEAEVAGIYVVADDGTPVRIGMAIGNEFTDHRFEKSNYLNLAGAKIRTSALGPELVLDAAFDRVAGEVRIERGPEVVWSQQIATGEAEMCHSLANIEHHHFKFESHRHPGDVHVHFYGAHSISYGAGIELTDGDVMAIRFEGFGRPLRNPLRRSSEPARLVTVRTFA